LLWGIPTGNDLPQHFQFAVTIRNSVEHGVLFPSWAADVNGGFGDAGVRFYPPLSYYVLDVFEWTFGDWFYATAATVCLMFFVGGIGVYLWCREYFSNTASVIGGIVYILVPYRVNEIYNAFTFAEFAATAVLPFCFLFVARICRRGSVYGICGL